MTVELNALPISQVIANQLEESILKGDLLPRQKIASERQLTSKYGVSRSVVREALRDLHGRGLIETRQGQGSFVTDMVPEPAEDSAFMQSFIGHDSTVFDLYEVREQLEGQAASLAAQRGTREDFYKLTKAFNGLENTDVSGDPQWDHEFHWAIARASHNAVLIHVLSSLDKLMLHSVELCVTKLRSQEKMQQKIDKHHRQIYHAVINRQAQWAQKAAVAHVRYACEQLRKSGLTAEDRKTF
ncbi:GntR family transcriptional regulator [Endozoicomonas sp. (ex Bugula neritina AB1)]|nr:GntR family transcriptional regulator [Endozoicomonas sp. (ex Bugula neritina AB1)]